jgi:Immunity protein 49
MDFDDAQVRENYDFYRERVEKGRAAVEHDPNDQLRVYNLFEDALKAAGFARALGRPAADVQAHLEAAARAAVDLFRLHGTLAGVSDDVDVDTSATNPDTFVRAVFAALAAGGPEELDALGSVSPESYHSDQVEGSQELDALARALQQVLTDDVDGARATLAAAGDGGDPYAAAQIGALDRLLTRDKRSYDAALEELLALHLQQYADRPLSADRFLRLPALGLNALAMRLGLE